MSCTYEWFLCQNSRAARIAGVAPSIQLIATRLTMSLQQLGAARLVESASWWHEVNAEGQQHWTSVYNQSQAGFSFYKFLDLYSIQSRWCWVRCRFFLVYITMLCCCRVKSFDFYLLLILSFRTQNLCTSLHVGHDSCFDNILWEWAGHCWLTCNIMLLMIKLWPGNRSVSCRQISGSFVPA